jgi:hypothetical protein
MPRSEAVHRNLNPTIAARARRQRIRALASKAAFLRSYRSAWQRYRNGARDVKFPPGTYALRHYSVVDCE